MIRRYVFQRSRSMPGKQFLEERLQGAVAYDRIAGYFDSSLFELAGEALEQVHGTIRIICNSDISARDVDAASALAREQAQRLSFLKKRSGIYDQARFRPDCQACAPACRHRHRKARGAGAAR